MKIQTLEVTTKITIAAVSFLLGGDGFTNTLYAQTARPFELSLVPSVGFNFSFFRMLPGYSVKDFNYTKGLIGSRDFYWGIGLQAGIWNDWKATIAVSQAFMGGGFRYSLEPITSLRVKTYGISVNSAITNAFTLNIEKKLWRSKDLSIKKIEFSTEVNLLWGAGFYWIPPADRVVDTLKRRSSNGIERETIFIPRNNVSGMVNFGLTNQFYTNNRPSLKVGVMYSYGLTPSREFQYRINYFYNDNPQEDFNAISGKHRLLVYLEYPIVLYRNKAQKEYLKGALDKRK